MAYELLRLRSEDGETREVIFHMCNHDGVDSLEILAPNGGVIVTRETFARVCDWVQQQFEGLSSEVRRVH